MGNSPVVGASCTRAWLRLLTVAALLAGAATSSVLAQTPSPDQQRPAPVDPDASLTDLALEDLVNVKVYAASKFVQDVAQAPASVTVVGAEDVHRVGVERRAGREGAPVGAARRLLPLGGGRQARLRPAAVGGGVLPGDEDDRQLRVRGDVVGVVPVRRQVARPAGVARCRPPAARTRTAPSRWCSSCRGQSCR